MKNKLSILVIACTIFTAQAVPTFEQTFYEQDNWRLQIFYDPDGFPNGLTHWLDYYIDDEYYISGPAVANSGIHFDWYVNTPFDNLPGSVFAPGTHTPSYIITYNDLTTEQIFGVPFVVTTPTGENPHDQVPSLPDAGATFALLGISAFGLIAASRRARGLSA
jgi:hypothetical protein